MCTMLLPNALCGCVAVGGSSGCVVRARVRARVSHGLLFVWGHGGADGSD